MNIVKRWLRDWLQIENQRLPMVARNGSLRARPGQALEAQMFAYSTGPNFDSLLAMYALSNWVNSAVGRLASRAAAAELMVQNPDNPIQVYPDHPILELLGARGRPNDYLDALEFWEAHFTTLDLAGNVYWFWWNDSGVPGAPTEIHQLEPSQVTVMPGRRLGVEKYVYRVMGHEYDLPPWSVTHFKRTNPFNRYYGLSALEALRVEVASDRSMAEWNYQFFDADVAVPAGIMVVPENVSDDELHRIEDELSGKYGERRRTAVVRSAVGATVYHPAGIAPRDMDFTNGRMLSRKAVYEALELPLGLMSEASTEAHARVAERQLAETIRIRHVRTVRKLNTDAMWFWPGASKRVLEFEDLSLRSADWDRESKHLAAVKPFMLENEVRERILHLPALGDKELQELRSVNGSKSAGAGQQSDRGNNHSQPDTGQVQNMVDSGNQPAPESVQ